MPQNKSKAKPKANGNGNGNGNGGGRPRKRKQAPLLQSIQPLMRTTANYRPMNNKVHQMSGSDFLSTVSVNPSIVDPDDRVLSVLSVSPSLFPGTRLAVMSQLFERYRFVSFRVRYVPAVPTTLGCQLLAYLDTDPLDDPSQILDGDQLLRQATAHTGSQQWNFNTPKIISLPMRSDGQLYYTGLTRQNERFNVQAKIYLLQVTRPVDINGAPVASPIECGSLYIDCNLRFETPQINPYAVTSPFANSAVLSFGVSTSPVGTLITLSGFAPNTKFGCLPNIVLRNNGNGGEGAFRMRAAFKTDGVEFDYGTDPGVVIFVGRQPAANPSTSLPKPACLAYDTSSINPAENVFASDGIVMPLISDGLGRIIFYVSGNTYTGNEGNVLKLFFVQGLASPVTSSVTLSPLTMRATAAPALADSQRTADNDDVIMETPREDTLATTT